jgi:holliday junction DNA helicase RuvA
MIAHLDGVVTAVAPEGAVIEVGGVGLLVQCSPGTLAALRPGERARVCTSLVVREDALTLYGFGSDDERNTFELLQTASGIGPRLALAMLATLSPDALRRAVAAEDLPALMAVPGIGRKGAQRIVLELAGRLGSPGDGGPAGSGLPGSGLPGGRASGPGMVTWRDQVRTGLVNLGWQVRDADHAIAAIEPEVTAGLSADGADGGNGAAPAGVDVGAALRAALRVLGRT